MYDFKHIKLDFDLNSLYQVKLIIADLEKYGLLVDMKNHRINDNTTSVSALI